MNSLVAAHPHAPAPAPAFTSVPAEAAAVDANAGTVPDQSQPQQQQQQQLKPEQPQQHQNQHQVQPQPQLQHQHQHHDLTAQPPAPGPAPAHQSLPASPSAPELPANHALAAAHAFEHSQVHVPLPTTDTEDTGRALRSMRLSAMRREMERNNGRTDLHKKLCPCPKCLSKLDEGEISAGHLRLVTHNTAVAHHKRFNDLYVRKDPNELQSVALFELFFGLQPTVANILHVLHIFSDRQGFPRGGRKRKYQGTESESEGGEERRQTRTAVEAAAAAYSAAAAAAGNQVVPHEGLSVEMTRLIEQSHAQPWLYGELVRLFRVHGIILVDAPPDRVALIAQAHQQEQQQEQLQHHAEQPQPQQQQQLQQPHPQPQQPQQLQAQPQPHSQQQQQQAQ